ncbi:unnamed protein product [Aphanomyces euteiches]
MVLWLVNFMALFSATAIAAEDAAADDCGALLNAGEPYDLPLHVAAVFIILGVSFLGSMFPVVAKHVACLRKNPSILALLNSFGFGVVLSTAFVHLIPPAVETFNNPCLNIGYEGLGMVFVVATVLLMQVLETELVLLVTKPAGPVLATDEEDAEHGNGAISVFASATTPAVSNGHGHHHHHASNSGLKEQSDTRKKLNVLIFEIGVAVHSVIVGLEMGVATGTSLKTLLIAICFHQFFEGIAVGSSAVSAFSTARSSILTAIMFSLSTPIGIAIGIGVNSTYSETSVTSLWVRGTMDAVAGGILIYTSIVELLTYLYTINPEFHAKSSGLRSLNYLFLWLGAAAMAIVGKWA